MVCSLALRISRPSQLGRDQIARDFTEVCLENLAVG
jgi:hypothetical protein